jgi:hypothetical protein
MKNNTIELEPTKLEHKVEVIMSKRKKLVKEEFKKEIVKKDV